MNIAAHGITAYSFRNGMASAPQLDTTRVSLVSLTVVKTYMNRNIITDMQAKCGSSDLLIGNFCDIGVLASVFVESDFVGWSFAAWFPC